MERYLGWESLEEVKRDFFGNNVPDDSPRDDEIIVAWYDTKFYSGHAFVLFWRGGKLYEVNASHCSCFGLEGQWDPEETTAPALKMRWASAFPFCRYNCELYEDFIELLDSLAQARGEW